MNSKNILLPSRLIIEKGIIEYVEAAKIIKNEFKDWNFLIAGTADYKNPSSIGIEEIKSWQDQGLIIWKGFINNLDELYGNCSIVCLPFIERVFLNV